MTNLNATQPASQPVSLSADQVKAMPVSVVAASERASDRPTEPAHSVDHVWTVSDAQFVEMTFSGSSSM